MDESLQAFLEHARAKGLDYQATRELLRAQGWKDKDIAEGYAAAYLDEPVPPPKGASTARETFTYFAAFGGLYTWVIALIVLVFTFINLHWVDAVEGYDSYRAQWAYSAIRQSIAAILVSFPIFLWLWRAILREIAQHPEKASSKVRTTLTYISLGVAVITLVADVITLVFFLLEGELTTRFVLKVVALFLIAGSACIYLVQTLRESERLAPEVAA